MVSKVDIGGRYILLMVMKIHLGSYPLHRREIPQVFACPGAAIPTKPIAYMLDA